MRRIVLACFALLFATTQGVAGQTYTIAQVLGAPFPSAPVAAPAGGHVAWVQNDRGERNIWIASPPDYHGRQITAYRGDDGQEIGAVTFTPDGERIVYVRGGAPNRRGEVPNPTSEPEWSDRAIWIVSASGGEPRRLAEGSGPTVSPRGDVMAFTRSGQVWSVPLRVSDDDSDPQQMFAIRGGAGSLRWAPSGTRLAFVSARGDHAFVGVFDLVAGEVRYLAPSVDRDGNPVWSPDGAEVAFIRIPNRGAALPFEPVREAHPWSILVADAANGETRTVFTAAPGRGSAFRNVVAANQLLWGADGRLVFPWERNGWTNLYSVPANRSTASDGATPLTPGPFEVEDVVLSPDGRSVIYSSNQNDIDRRHLWRVPVTGGAATALTTGRGIEWGPAVSSDNGAIAFAASDATTPAHARIFTGANANRPLAPETMPRDFPSQALVEPEAVVFSGADGMRIHAQLFRPPARHGDGPHPAAVFFHGGSRRQMLLGFHYRGYYHNAYALNQYLASRGFVVLSVNYRSGIGYGMEFREALNYGARGASEFNDVLGAGIYLRSRDDVDPDRIGLWGGSYGGYLTALGLARASDLFAAGVDVHGVHDWNVVVNNFVPSYNAAARAEWADLAYQSSPMAHLDGWRSPVLLIHGDDDRNVPFSETVDLAESLRDRGIEFEQLIFPDEVHGFLLHRNWIAAYEATAEFLERKLGRVPRADGDGRASGR